MGWLSDRWNDAKDFGQSVINVVTDAADDVVDATKYVFPVFAGATDIALEAAGSDVALDAAKIARAPFEIPTELAIESGDVIVDIATGQPQKDAAAAAEQAAATQAEAAQNGINEQRRQFDTIVKNLEPYLTGGQSAYQQQLNSLGLNGADAQKAYIDNVRASEEFKALIAEGENSILQNASATGGLRGGNTQQALSQYSPQILSNLLDRNYTKLSGLSTMGQNSAVLQGNAGMNMATNISDGFNQIGAANAGAQLARQQAEQSRLSGLLGLGGAVLGGLYGGPTGAAAGASIGSSFGGQF